jgi:hypothetical protein
VRKQTGPNTIDMPTLAYIYIRTPQGRATAFNSSATLYPQLKTLLKAVDGKITSTVLVTHFAHLGNVEKLLFQLEASGFIADRGSAFAKVQDIKSPDEVWNATANPLVQTSMLTKQPIDGSADDASSSTFAASQTPDWSPTTSSGLQATVAPKPDTLLDRMVSQVVDWMSTFMLTYMPDKAFTELAAIEKIRTPEQLIADLPRYEALVKPLGPTGTLHIDELKQLIQKLFAPAPASGPQV